MLAVRGHRLVEVVCHRIEPVVHRTVKLGLPTREEVAHPFDAHRGLRLQAREFGHLPIGGLAVASARRLHGQHHQRAEDCERRHADREGSGE